MKVKHVYKAYVTEVTDGDSVKVAIDLGFHIVTNIRIRLAGIDAKEMRDEKNKEKALAAKKWLEENVLNKELVLKSLKTGKYHNRYIAFLYDEDGKESYNDKMVKLGLVTPYEDKRKKPEKPNAD